jgi:hypothetical protein
MVDKGLRGLERDMTIGKMREASSAIISTCPHTLDKYSFLSKE